MLLFLWHKRPKQERKRGFVYTKVERKKKRSEKTTKKKKVEEEGLI